MPPGRRTPEDRGRAGAAAALAPGVELLPSLVEAYVAQVRGLVSVYEDGLVIVIICWKLPGVGELLWLARLTGTYGVPAGIPGIPFPVTVVLTSAITCAIPLCEPELYFIQSVAWYAAPILLPWTPGHKNVKLLDWPDCRVMLVLSHIVGEVLFFEHPVASHGLGGAYAPDACSQDTEE